MVYKVNVRKFFYNGIRCEESRRDEPVRVSEWDTCRAQHSIDSPHVLLTQWQGRMSYGPHNPGAVGQSGGG